MKGVFVIYGYEFGALIMFRVGVSMLTMCGLKLMSLLVWMECVHLSCEEFELVYVIKSGVQPSTATILSDITYSVSPLNYNNVPPMILF